MSNQSVNKHLVSTYYILSLAKSWGELKNSNTLALEEVIIKTSDYLRAERPNP